MPELKDIAVACIETAPIETLGPVARALADTVFAYRQAHKGWTPASLFGPCITLGGAYPALEIVVEVADDAGNSLGYALKKRGGDDQGWAGKYHVIGASATMGEGPEAMLRRLSKELYGDVAEDIGKFPRRLEFLGVSVHYEEPRRARCWTSTFLLCVNRAEFARFVGMWEIFQRPFDNERIIDHHRAQLRWATDAGLGVDSTHPFFADLADYPDP